MDRRDFLKNLATAGVTGAAAAGLPAVAKAQFLEEAPTTEFVAVLVDTKRCIGCRDCEVACATANGLPVPDTQDKTVFEAIRDTTPDAWTVVNRFQTDVGPVYVKKQCMHCNQAACSTACLTQAMYKTKEGPVIWRASKCMGCRFCMVSCPFVIPRFEYFSANPKIQKCILCNERLAEGEIPACVQSCPVDALQFGTRREMINVARNRINDHPQEYLDHIYGENEVGGTGWFYLSQVPFEQIGFRTDLGHESVPKLTQSFLYGVPVVFLLWPAFLHSVFRKDDDLTELAPDEPTPHRGEKS